MEACISLGVGWYNIVRYTYNTESTNKLLWRLNTGCDNHLDEVGADANNDDHADGLKDSDSKEHLAQRHGVIGRDRHDERS